MTTPTVFFGQPWHGRHPDTALRVGPPIGHVCCHCIEPIAETDRGSVVSSVRMLNGMLTLARAPVHMECELRSAVGGLGHLLGDDEPWCGSYRAEATAVLAEINRMRQHYRMGPL